MGINQACAAYFSTNGAFSSLSNVSWDDAPRVLANIQDVKILLSGTHQSLNTSDSKQPRLAFAQSFQNGRTSRLIFAATPFQKTFRVRCHFASSVFCQEALHNAVKYSGVNVFEVSLTGSPQEIELKVHDSGVGFDAKVASNGHGLGLTSMRERVRLVDGQLSIDSKPNQGTTVFARVPLSEETATASTAA
jgi:signal transduction histidine kinase